MRVFQALLAGSRVGNRKNYWSDEKAHAFRWLEQCDPPRIFSPEVREAASYTLFVPNNDSDKIWDRQDRLTTKIARPHRLINGNSVHYIWSIQSNETASNCANVIAGEARHLLALGWGIDQVVGNGAILTESESNALPGRAWRPWRAHRPGSTSWRVPISGSLHDLEQAHISFLKRITNGEYQPERKPTQFGTIEYMNSMALPPRSYAAFELPEGVAFRAEQTAMVAAMLRSVACSHAKSDTHEFPGGPEVYVAGHIESRSSPARFSYLPLPTIGHEHADGMIRRVLVAEPFGGEGAHAQWAQRRLLNTALRDKDGNDRGILVDLWRPGSNRIRTRYVDPARNWCSVTPAILPGFDDGKHTKAENLFLKAMMQAEIPIEAVDQLTLRKAPFWPGGQHPRAYFAPEYLRNFSRWHVWIRFKEPLPGPLAIGVGRHVGLGLFGSPGDARAH